jgi:hypothetical protein
MINWVETFREYIKWINWKDSEITHLCHWYQNRCRIYGDENG